MSVQRLFYDPKQVADKTCVKRHVRSDCRNGMTYVGILISTCLTLKNVNALTDYTETNSLSATQEILRCYGTRKFITMFTLVRHVSLSRARLVHSTPFHPIPSRSMLLLSSQIQASPRSFDTFQLQPEPIHSTCFATLPRPSARCFFSQSTLCLLFVQSVYRSNI
jgi:hypothetical protein